MYGTMRYPGEWSSYYIEIFDIKKIPEVKNSSETQKTAIFSTLEIWAPTNLKYQSANLHWKSRNVWSKCDFNLLWR